MRRLIAGLAALAALFCLLLPVSASAYDPLSGACKAGGTASTATPCHNDGRDTISGPNGALRRATLLISIFAGIAAVIIIIIGALQYVTSNGDPQKAAGARSTILGAVIGLMIIAAAEGIITFVINKL